MSSRVRPFAPLLIGTLLALASLGHAGDARAARAGTFTLDYAPLGFQVKIAYPEEGHLCIIVPESAQDPAACLGLDTDAMVAALPDGPGRPFGVAKARMGDWSYLVMLTPVGTGIESKEDIDEFVAGAKPEPSEDGAVPKLIGPAPDRTYEILKIKDVPVVKFRLETGVPPASPDYDASAMLHYAGFGGKTAMVSFIASPKDMERVLPYAEATVQSLVLPPREAPERFGKPRAELEKAASPAKAIAVLGPLVALGALLFLWLGRSKKAEPEQAAPPKARRRADRPVEEREKDFAAEEEDAEKGEESGQDDAGDDEKDDEK